jgi:hypothetical protein
MIEKENVYTSPPSESEMAVNTIVPLFWYHTACVPNTAVNNVWLGDRKVSIPDGVVLPRIPEILIAADLLTIKAEYIASVTVILLIDDADTVL